VYGMLLREHLCQRLHQRPVRLLRPSVHGVRAERVLQGHLLPDGSRLRTHELQGVLRRPQLVCDGNVPQ
jgi:hypothetical protein